MNNKSLRFKVVDWLLIALIVLADVTLMVYDFVLPRVRKFSRQAPA